MTPLPTPPVVPRRCRTAPRPTPSAEPARLRCTGLQPGWMGCDIVLTPRGLQHIRDHLDRSLWQSPA